VPEKTAHFDTIGEVLGILKIHFLAKNDEEKEDEGTADHVNPVESRHREVDRVVVAVTRTMVAHELDLLAGDDEVT
jgi:hypothetical protein